ncbi:hypothetical protein HBA55_15745 [Pseudomaricurvus alkylphenolicus]|uniref:hypothetical protein n=1 Tax=Pseudomaricurvus alkylphenolicus TaxID=1306991 RepID=UPI00142296B3|nr:hypothetical protein [Pseudomaricurvus alkylphenolicus]NIB41057.1 hypothetical protein [Pseudomaricurvus alkylphenolicus]
MTTTDSTKLHVGFLLQPQFTLLSLSGMIEALRIVADVGGLSKPVQCRWTLMTILQHELMVESVNGLSV